MRDPMDTPPGTYEGICDWCGATAEAGDLCDRCANTLYDEETQR